MKIYGLKSDISTFKGRVFSSKDLKLRALPLKWVCKLNLCCIKSRNTKIGEFNFTIWE